MIDTEALRKKVIDLAIQGKLTEQLPSDGDAESLYAQIQEEKENLIKTGNLKKEKPMPLIFENDIPFDIPCNWKWVYMGEIFDHNTGKALNNADNDGIKLEYITTSNMYWDHFELDGLKSMYFKESEIEKCTITKGDLLICEGGDIGRSAIWAFDYDMRIQNHIHKLRGYGGIEHKFYFYIMRNYKDNGMIDGRGIGLQGFSSKRVHSLIVPLPPLAEQKRIVEKLDTVLKQIDIIDTLQQQYESDLSVLKGKIIDAGIRGKLTEQLPEDGDAEILYSQIQEEKATLIKEGKIKKEKPLPDIAADEIPFEIPKNWKWVRLYSMTNKITDGTHHSPINTSEGDYMYVTAKNIKPDGINLDDITYVSSDIHEEIYSRCNPERNDVLLIKDGATTGVVTVNNLDFPFSMLSSVALIKTSKHIEPWFVAYAMRSSWFAKHIKKEMTGVGITRVVLRQIESFVLPLPPYEEQKRITKQIGELHKIIA